MTLAYATPKHSHCAHNSHGGSETPNSQIMSENIDDETRLWRLLSLGGSRAIFRPGYRQIEDTDADVIRRLIDDGKGFEVINYIKKAAENHFRFYPLAYALAICATSRDNNLSKQAYRSLIDVCRTPTHLFQFLSFCKTSFGVKSWSRRHRQAIASWYLERYRGKEILLARHVTKYKRRHGFSQKKVIKSCHPKPANDLFKYIFCYVTRGINKANALKLNKSETLNEIIGFISSVEKIKNGKCKEEEIIIAIQKRKLNWEHIPTQFRTSAEVWRTLLKTHVPIKALIRNLGRLSKLKLLESKSEEQNKVCEVLNDIDALENSGIHPLVALAAWAGYRRGRGLRSSEDTWEINQKVVKALYNAYTRLSDKRPSFSSQFDKQILIAVDVNMAMDQHVVGIPSLSCKEAAIAISRILQDSESSVRVIQFLKKTQPIDNQSTEDMFDFDFVDEDLYECEPNFISPFEFASRNRCDSMILLTDTLSTKNIEKIRNSFKKYSKSPKPCINKLVTVCFKNSRPAGDQKNPSMLDLIGIDQYGFDVMRNFIHGYHKDMTNITRTKQRSVVAMDIN